MSEESNQQPNDQASNPEDKKQEQPKTFTQEELNGIAAKEAKKAQEKLLKQLGIDDFDSAKDGLSKFKEWQESQKTEQQKQQEELTQFKTQLSEKEILLSNVKAENAAIKLGVTEEKNLNAVVTLAKTRVTDEVDINAAIKQVIEEFPHFGGKQEEVQKPTFSSGEHKKTTQSEMDKWLQAFNK